LARWLTGATDVDPRRSFELSIAQDFVDSRLGLDGDNCSINVFDLTLVFGEKIDFGGSG
jgi:hypothetical protein